MAVALSGGKDSSALLVILDYLRRHSHLSFQLLGVHVRMGHYDTSSLVALCQKLQVPYREVQLEIPHGLPQRGVCSLCARLKRGAMARVLAEEGIRRLALAHHADDVAHTLLMNLGMSGSLRSFAPRVTVPGEPMELIRPLVYLREATLEAIHRRSGMPRVGEGCPFGQGAMRHRAREALRGIEAALGVKDLPLRIVAALERAGLWSSGEPAPGAPSQTRKARCYTENNGGSKRAGRPFAGGC